MPVALCLVIGLLSGCLASDNQPPAITVGSCSLSLPADSDDSAAIRAVLLAEGELVVKKAIDPLMLLWDEASFVANAQHTPNDARDDQFWRGWDAIRHRYLYTVFNGDAKFVAPAELTVAISAEHAEVIATTKIDQEMSRAGDRWTLLKKNGCWLLESLTFDLEAQ